MRYLFKILLTINSLSLTLSVYLVKSDFLLNSLTSPAFDKKINEFICNLPNFISYALYFIISIFFTYISILLIRFLDDEVLSSNTIKTVETANDSFLPSYLGYFFVALSINDIYVLIYVFSIIFIFTFFSKISYFNPIFLLFGYKFFHLTDDDGLKIVVITKMELKKPSEVCFSALKRINNYTFISTESY